MSNVKAYNIEVNHVLMYNSTMSEIFVYQNMSERGPWGLRVSYQRWCAKAFSSVSEARVAINKGIAQGELKENKLWIGGNSKRNEHGALPKKIYPGM